MTQTPAPATPEATPPGATAPTAHAPDATAAPGSDRIPPTWPTPAVEPVFPQGRYGRRRAPGRPARAKRLRLAFLLLGVLIMGAIAVRLYVQYGSQEFSPQVLSYSDVTDSSITVSFEVGKPDGVAAACTLQAFSYEDNMVGQAQASVPAAGTQAHLTYTIKTTSKAYAVEIPVCDVVH